MNLFSIIILGIVQGIAEFLPISSSAHLIIFRDLFGIGKGMPSDVALAFDIALHLGTLLAIAVFFFKDFINMLVKGFTKGTKDKDGRTLWYIVIATIPAALAGVLLEDFIENTIRGNLYVIGVSLALMGVILYIADQKGKQDKKITTMTLKDTILIGCSQAFALIPGFSRSGTTIAAARALGMEREDSAKFSFYLSAPVVCGAVVLELLDKATWTIIAANASSFIIGIVISFLTGLICVKYLLQYLHNHNFKIFMVYRVLMAILVIVMMLVR